MSTDEQSLTLPKPNRTSSLNSQIELGINSQQIELVVDGFNQVLLEDIRDRGYGQNLFKHSTRELEEIEVNFYKSIISKHLHLLSVSLPILVTGNVGSGVEGGDVSSSSGTVRAPQRPHNPTHNSSRPSPLSSQFQSNQITSTVTNPSALFLVGLLSILISLHSEDASSYDGFEEEEVESGGLVGELKRLKVRRDLTVKLFALVTELLDSYLISGEGEGRRSGIEEGKDTLVDLLYRDFPLHYDSTQRTVCALDLLITLSSYSSIEGEQLISHPVVLSSTEFVWNNGLLPRAVVRNTIWWKNLTDLDRFSTPCILHAQTYFLSTFYAALSIYILISSHYSHFYSLNPLAPDSNVIGIPEEVKGKGWSLLTFFLWWFWVFASIGWMGEVIRSWRRRVGGGTSSLNPLLAHVLIFSSVLCRFSILLVGPNWIVILLPTSVSLLAWSIPLLAMSRILPQKLTTFGNPTHFEWKDWFTKSKREKGEYKISPPSKRIPESYRALRSLEEKLGGIIQFGSYLLVCGVLLLWSLAGELDYPGIALGFFHSPSRLLFQDDRGFVGITLVEHLASPIEARTTLAFTFFLGLVLAYFSGGRASSTIQSTPSSHLSTNSAVQSSLTDLDSWNLKYGSTIAFESRLERIILCRHFTYLPFSSNSTLYEETTLRAFSTPPLSPPFNLLLPFLYLFSTIYSLIIGSVASVEGEAGENGRGGRKIQEGGRKWIWRSGLILFGLSDAVVQAGRVLAGRNRRRS